MPPCDVAAWASGELVEYLAECVCVCSVNVDVCARVPACMRANAGACVYDVCVALFIAVSEKQDRQPH